MYESLKSYKRVNKSCGDIRWLIIKRLLMHESSNIDTTKHIEYHVEISKNISYKNQALKQSFD